MRNLFSQYSIPGKSLLSTAIFGLFFTLSLSIPLLTYAHNDHNDHEHEDDDNPVVLSCSPASQTVTVGETASFSFISNHSDAQKRFLIWDAPLGNPDGDEGQGLDHFQTTYSEPGDYTITVFSMVFGNDPSLCHITVEPAEVDVPVLGCTDPEALNYNADATEDDDSCRYEEDPPAQLTATIVASKVVCPTENLLPNWGAGGNDIISTTATDFVSAHPTCHIVPWTLEWAPNNTPNPGDHVLIAGGVWTSFTSTVTVPAGALIWVREQFDNDYIHFTGANTTQNVSAELYCSTDVLNYDNYDWINPVLAGHTYHCIGFNVLNDDDIPPPPPPPSPTPITVAISANPSSITVGQSSNLSWTSTNANICNALWTVATSTSGVQIVSPNTTTEYTVTCGNGTASSTATTTVTVTIPTVTPPPAPTGGSDGGGTTHHSSGGSSRPPTSGGVVLSASTSVCFYLKDYMRRDFNNDPLEVLKLQAFLINFEGHTNVSLTGVFDQATFDAVSAFQMKYFKDILEPWGHTGSTGYVYILTLKKVNEIYCQRIFPLNQSQINEIVAFHALLDSLREQGINPELPSQIGQVGGVSTSTIPAEPEPSVTGVYKGQNISCSACMTGLILAWPGDLSDTLQCAYRVLWILIVLYVLATIFKNVFYKDTPQNSGKRFMVRWLTVNIGLIASVFIAFILGWWCLILPLLIALLISLIWAVSYPEHNSIRASVKSWYLVGLARAKTITKNFEKKSVIVLPQESLPLPEDSTKTTPTIIEYKK